MDPATFLTELKRRKVYRVAVAYAIVAWLLIQAASILFPTFEAPLWVMKVFVTAVILGFPVALIRVGDAVVAFANVWVGADRTEISVDLMRYTSVAPPGVMEFLLIELMLWGKENGYQRFNLGMAPLSGIENRSLAPLWNRVGALLFSRGEPFYNFQGLRLYKEKFDPLWEPRYLASPGGLVLPRILTNVASLISGGLVGVVSK